MKNRRIILRSVITVILAFMIFGFLSLIYEYTTDDYVPETSLRSALDRGDYSGMVDYYDIVKYLYDFDKDEEYGRYTEFVEFYRAYILYVESGDPSYQRQMKEIMDQTVYEDNQPHYQYLYELPPGYNFEKKDT